MVAVARHDTILRQAVDDHEGQIVKRTGDGVLAAFARVTSALAAGLAAQRALVAEVWGETGPLKARMALHTGEAEHRADDYFGPALNRTARLMAAGHGGQILLSQATFDRVRHAAPPDVIFQDLGEHRLKDLIRSERVYQAVASDLPAIFTPLNTLDNHPNNLPIQLTPLIGREREIASVRERLRDPRLRLLTLTGPGGIGKTRLALQAAAELVEAFRDGAFFVSLDAVRDPSLVALTLAQVLEVKETAGLSLVQNLKEALRGREMLLLLDNFEHLEEAAPLVTELLVSCPGLKVLVTSRAALHLGGEHELAVPSLSLPDRGSLPSIDRLESFEAVRLFVERAQAVKPDFALTEDTAEAIVEICRRLGGLPLAIELATARIKVLAPADILDRLENRLRLLTGGPKDLPARQQTLRNTISWSYELLSEGEQAMFRRLAVFAGGCTFAAAEAVCGDAGAGDQVSGVGAPRPLSGSLTPAPAPDVLDGLTALVDRSLLQQEEVGGETRFAMLETIREYALERLTESEEELTSRARHAGYHLALADPRITGYVASGDLDRITRLNRERDNERAALRWFEEQGDVAAGMRVIEAMSFVWAQNGPLAEGRVWLERFRGMSQFATASLEVRVLTLLANALLDSRRDPVATRASAVELLALAQEAANPGWLERALSYLAWSSLELGELSRAEGELARGLDLARELNLPEAVGETLMLLGDVARLRGNDGLARARYEECRAMVAPWTWGSEWELRCLGFLAVHRGDLDEAESLFRESLDALENEPNTMARIECLGGFVSLCAARGEAVRAARLLGAVDAALDQIGVKFYFGSRFERERALRVLHAALSEAAFNAAWAEGKEMPLEQALVDAVKESRD